MSAFLTMSQTHVCFVSANMDATRNQDPAVFSAVIVHVLVQSALLNHGQLIDTLHHLATVTTLTAAIILLEFLLYLAIVYKQTSHKSVPVSTDLYTGCVFRDLPLLFHTLFSHSVVRTIEGFVLRITSLV